MCPGLVVMGNDSRSEWMDIFLHIFVVKSNVCLKRPKINEKESGVGPLKNKLKIIMKHMYGNNLYMFDYWVEPVVHLLLLKSSMSLPCRFFTVKF